MRCYWMILVGFIIISFVTGIIVTINENKDVLREAKVKRNKTKEKKKQQKIKVKKEKKAKSIEKMKEKKNNSSKKSKNNKKDNKEEIVDKPILISSVLCEETLDMPQDKDLVK